MNDKEKGLQCRLLQAFKRILYRKKLAEMDWIWHRIYGNCLGDFPPSFYRTHTRREIMEIKGRERKTRERLLDEMEKDLLKK